MYLTFLAVMFLLVLLGWHPYAILFIGGLVLFFCAMMPATTNER